MPTAQTSRKRCYFLAYAAKLVLLWLLYSIIINNFVTFCAVWSSGSRTAPFVSSWVTHGGNPVFFRWLLFLRYIINIWSKSSHLHHMLLRGPSEKVSDQSICRTKEQKARLQCLASAMPKSVLPSAAKNSKASKKKKRKNLAVLAKTPRLKRFFFSKAFKQ